MSYSYDPHQAVNTSPKGSALIKNEKNLKKKEGTSSYSTMTPKAKDEDNSGKSITRTLGGRTYTITPSHLDPERPTVRSIILKGMKYLVLFILSPLIITFAVLFSAMMYFGPKSIQHKFLSWFVPKVMSKVDKKFAQDRNALLSGMRKHHKVLDVGSGGGAYVKYCKGASSIVALEMITEMHDTIRTSAKKAGMSLDKLEILPYDVETYLKLNGDDIRETFDWIIFGNVLCEVSSIRSTLDAADQLLKVGGHVYFSEHVGCPRGSTRRFLQNLVNPWWNVVGGGCNCNRDTLEIMRSSMTNWEVISWQYDSFRVFMGPFVLGLATKTRSQT